MVMSGPRGFYLGLVVGVAVLFMESRCKIRYPVVLVPGDGGSQIEAQLNKSNRTYVYCEEKTDYYYTLWLDLTQISLAQECFVDNMRLVYDRNLHKTNNSPGVNIRVPGFSSTETVEFLDPGKERFTTYYFPLVDRLVKLGYIRNVSLRGAPYDFRRAPNEMDEYFIKFKNLIEETYRINNNTRIVLVGHSMGCPTILYFLKHQSQAWKDKFLKSFVSLSGVWGGAVKTMRLMSSGDNLGIFVVSPLVVRPYQRSAVSTAWLLPYDTFWGSGEVLVTRPGHNYTVGDYEKFFRDLNYIDGYLMRKDTEHLVKDLPAPGVELHCVHGSQVQTPALLNFTKGWPNTQPTITYGDGDGTVNMRSLVGCLRWNKTQTVKHKVIPRAEHLTILKNDEMIDYVVSVAISD